MPSPITNWVGLTNSTGTMATTSTVATTGSNLVWVNTTSSTTPATMYIDTGQAERYVPYIPDDFTMEVGRAKTIRFPDGTVIDYKADGSLAIEDKDAKVIYKAARVRDFNPFLNASDKLEDFIKFCGTVGVRQGDMLGIPIRHFVQWLVIEAAKADGEQPPAPLALPDLRKPRCATCGRFISKEFKTNKMEFCRPSCFEIKYRQFHKEKYHDQVSDNSSVVVDVIERNGGELEANRRNE